MSRGVNRSPDKQPLFNINCEFFLKYHYAKLLLWVFRRTAQKNHLNETVLLSTKNICFGWEIRKIIYDYILLSKKACG